MHKDTIESALARLTDRKNEDAFVIFEEKSSGKFVQFSRTADQGLFLDLPSQTLNAAEMERATEYFLQQGVRIEEFDLFDGPGGKRVGSQCSFQKDFGQDIRAAADVVSEVFRRVFQFPAEFELVITEN